MPGLDARSRRLLRLARMASRGSVAVLVLARRGATAEARHVVEGRGGTVASSDEKTGSLRADVPLGVVTALTEEPSVTAVQILEDVRREEP